MAGNGLICIWLYLWSELYHDRLPVRKGDSSPHPKLVRAVVERDYAPAGSAVKQKMITAQICVMP